MSCLLECLVGYAGFLDQIGWVDSGKSVRVVVFREGGTSTILVTLGRRETAEGTSEPAPEPQAPEEVELLGMSLVLIDETVIKDKGLAENSEGLLILSVEADSEAANKGLLEGDIISEAGQQKVTSVADLTDRIDEAKEAGRKSLLLLVRRGTDPRFVALSLQ